SAMTALIDLPFLFIFIVVMYFYSERLTLIVMIFTTLSFLVYNVFGPFMRSRLKQKNEIQVDSQSYLFEMVNGIETVKAMSLEEQAQKKWNELLIQQSVNSAQSGNLTGNISLLSGFLSKSTTAVCLWVGALAVLDGTLTAGQLVGFNMMVGRVLGPAQRISQLLQQIQQVKLSIQRVGEIFNTPTEPFIKTTSQLPALKGNVRFENVIFKYHPDLPEVLNDISFDVSQGEIVGIIGPTGCGKT
ncbi:MAG: ATP-binding cassette domain-containing protein, partial [Proteobacteria bacterium]|nr:ATP-binding cassette domain-containing protein [Pseudomonadota bacterium]